MTIHAGFGNGKGHAGEGFARILVGQELCNDIADCLRHAERRIGAANRA
jgi:hypothetical protein